MFHLTEPSSAGKALRFRPQVNRLEDRSLPGSALDLFSPAAALGGSACPYSTLSYCHLRGQ